MFIYNGKRSTSSINSIHDVDTDTHRHFGNTHSHSSISSIYGGDHHRSTHSDRGKILQRIIEYIELNNDRDEYDSYEVGISVFIWVFPYPLRLGVSIIRRIQT